MLGSASVFHVCGHGSWLLGPTALPSLLVWGVPSALCLCGRFALHLAVPDLAFADHPRGGWAFLEQTSPSVDPGFREQPCAQRLHSDGCFLSPDIVSHKMVHFDLLHEDVSLQYFIPALS